MMALEWPDVSLSKPAALRAPVRVERARDGAQRRASSVCAANHPTRRRPASASAPAPVSGAGRTGRANPLAEDGPGSGSVGSTSSQARPRRRAYSAAHLLLSSGDARGTRSGHPGAGRTPGLVHDTALYALESGGGSAPGSARTSVRYWRYSGDGAGHGKNGLILLGKMVEAAGVEPASEGMAPWDSTCVSALYISPPVSKSGQKPPAASPEKILPSRVGAARAGPAH